jgi:hypothetical protein
VVEARQNTHYLQDIESALLNHYLEIELFAGSSNNEAYAVIGYMLRQVAQLPSRMSME